MARPEQIETRSQVPIPEVKRRNQELPLHVIPRPSENGSSPVVDVPKAFEDLPAGAQRLLPTKRKRKRAPRLRGMNMNRPGEFEEETPIYEDLVVSFEGLSKRNNVREIWTDGDQSGLNLFLTELHKYPLFTSVQERVAFRYLAEGKSIDDLIRDVEYNSAMRIIDADKHDNAFADSPTIKKLIANCNLRLVVSIARQYQNRGIPLLDLIQEGIPGLMTSIDRYDLSTGNKFSTYAVSWIKQSITRAIAGKAAIIRLPVYMYYDIGKAMKASDEFRAKHDRNPVARELREVLMSERMGRRRATLLFGQCNLL